MYLLKLHVIDFDHAKVSKVDSLSDSELSETSALSLKSKPTKPFGYGRYGDADGSRYGR